MESSLCEKPERHAPRRLSDHLGLEGLKQKVRSLVDKVYSRTNLTLAWERVRANRGSGGTDGISIEDFEAHLEINLDRLHRELRDGTYQPQPVRRIEIPKRGASGKTRPLGIPSVYDRVCQQAMVNRLERSSRKSSIRVVTCRTRAEAEHVLARAAKILEQLGVTLNRDKTRIVHVAHGFEFLGFKIKRGKRQFKLSHDRIKSKLTRQGLYAIPTQKSVDRFKDQIRALTKRRVPLRMGELIKAINPIVRGWGNYFCRSHVRKVFHQLDGWIVRRLWSHHAKRWRNTSWKHYPTKRLRGEEFKLIGLVSLIPSLQAAQAHP